MDAPILTRDESADAIARWWSRWLQAIAPMDNGDRSAHGNVGRTLAEMTARQRLLALPAGAPDRFEAALRGHILAVLDGSLLDLPDVDYHPNTILRRAATDSGFDPEYLFPIKSTTYAKRVEGGFLVWVRCGYGAERVALTRPAPTE